MGDARTSCLIVGCGYVGTRLARQETAHHRRVLALLRSGPRADTLRASGIPTLPHDLDSKAPDPEDVAALKRAAAGSAVAYLAPPPDVGASDPRLDRFLDALGSVRPACFVYVSTTGVYGDTAGALVDESAPVQPGNDRARRRVAAEQSVAQWCDSRNVRWALLRVPGIYGPWRLPLDRLQRGEPALRHDDAGPGNRIHVDDLVAAILAVIDDPRACGVYNVTDGNHASTTDYLIETARAAGLPEPPLIARSEAAGRISPGMLSFLLESRRVDNRRLREDLHLPLRHPTLRSGIAASLAEMRAAPDQ
jgi:nucleoside-diphosphate-sugar epimerase